MKLQKRTTLNRVIGTLFILTLVSPSLSIASMTKVAVIDSGFDKSYSNHVKLCPSGHYDFISDNVEVGSDTIGHGTHVALTVAEGNEKSNYCLLIYKIFASDKLFKAKSAEAIKMAVKNGASIINASYQGEGLSYKESEAAIFAERSRVWIVTSAGNDSKFLYASLNPATEYLDGRVVRDRATKRALRYDECRVYPACLARKTKNILVASSWDSTQSNKGSIVTFWRPFCVTNPAGTLCGTSQSTALATRDLVKWLVRK